MNNLKLITTHKDYLLLVDTDSVLQIGDKLIQNLKEGGFAVFTVVPPIGKDEEDMCRIQEQVWIRWDGKDYVQSISNKESKLVAHKPLHDNAPILEGVPLLPEFDQKNELEWFKAGVTYPPVGIDVWIRPEDGKLYLDKTLVGWDKAHRDYEWAMPASQNKRYTEEDMKKAILDFHDNWAKYFKENASKYNKGHEIFGAYFSKYLQSLSPVTLPVDFLPEYEYDGNYDLSKSKGSWFNAIEKHQNSKLKTIKSTFRGKEVEVLQGTYKY